MGLISPGSEVQILPLAPIQWIWISPFDSSSARRIFRPVKRILKACFSFTVFSLALPCFLLGAPAGSNTAPKTDAELQRLQGAWEGGVVGGPPQERITIKVSGNSLHFHRDTNFWFETTIALPAGTNPQQLHATIQHSAPPEQSNGQVVVAIFKIEGGKLTLVTGGGGVDDPPTHFDVAENKALTRYELRKVEPKEEKVPSPKTKPLLPG